MVNKTLKEKIEKIVDAITFSTDIDTMEKRIMYPMDGAEVVQDPDKRLLASDIYRLVKDNEHDVRKELVDFYEPILEAEAKAKAKAKEITIDGVVYVPVTEYQKAEKLDGLEYVLVRTYSAGVHVGYLESREGNEAILRQSRNIWYWDGAAGLSQLAVSGTSKPENCKFTVVVPSRTLIGVIEILPISKEAKESIDSVEPWTV